jgi:hypothetical protein
MEDSPNIDRIPLFEIEDDEREDLKIPRPKAVQAQQLAMSW